MLLDRSTIRLGEAECNFSKGRTVHFLEMFFCSNKVRNPQFFFGFQEHLIVFFVCVCLRTPYALGTMLRLDRTKFLNHRPKD